MLKIFSKLLDVNAREVERISKVVEQINSFEAKVKKLKDKDFAAKTEEFKKRLEKGETLENLLPEAYAVVREASYRVLGKRHYDVQLIAAVALFEGKVAEQKTGEGKTLSAVPALYLHALTGRGAHLVTVNDYLARRDAGWNAPIFHLLGMSVGSIVQETKSYIYDPDFTDSSHGDERLAHLKVSERRDAYACDILYGTNNEFGFDYLRDNMVNSLPEMVQRGHYFAIVDEVDSILIDEARTPLIISAPDTEPTQKYYKFAQMVDKLNPDTDYKIDEKSKSASLTEMGITRVEKILGVDNLYEKDFEAIHHIENALRARTLYLKDKDYVIKEDQVVIVDEFTGRLMVGRRWSDGLHQAVEAKESVPIQQESKTLATISFQNYFRMYEHLSGMTGTAATEAEEFRKIYKLDVIVIPTHRPMVRKDLPDVIYKTLRGKYGAIVDEIGECYKKGQPVLVGTTSIEKNEIISEYLKRKKITHNVLNAKNHEKEAEIIAEAGKPSAVTVATNMAGRGVDIVLGGALPDRIPGKNEDEYRSSSAYKEWEKIHEKVINAGGLHIIGTERHEARRVDNQLRGRSGRQGDSGSSRFYLSMEDDLMRIFGGEQIGGIMDRLSLPENQPIENSLISRAIEQAQVKVEGFHFDVRKRLVEFDDVANQQREIIYKLRRKILESKDVKEEVQNKVKDQIEKISEIESLEVDGKVDAERIAISLAEIIPFDDASLKRITSQISNLESQEKIKDFLNSIFADIYEKREKDLTSTVMREVEKFAYLGSIDHLWMDHIDHIDDLREGVTLRAYGQRDPLIEFKNEAYNLFENLVNKINTELSRRILRIGVARPQPEIPLHLARENVDRSDQTGLSGDAASTARSGEPAFSSSSSQSSKKLGRNDPCWCGSGKKWKHCHYPQLPAN
ncbi:preprotein translocase subunit SecA [Candidatus Woesebacteria bacterium RIFOXYC1_FULL_41_14]|uniref:Protein translocase subunit SecA n=6 Tax=Candidatus Woeseibacteriota TaxID=1752722 RepID=A0A0G0RT77_9BACT|nr:MAG: Protein translocase subunit SecA [Candidatus Woesebacteria bacterium GW2011_GWB1_40_12]KKR55899.1 MAG: Protein translocase subunit SecA [Candidatus Woesebacteria bacterium GW2011_GWF1_40_24]KKR90880.1 MAG: Protein translocase subunit SecA [Candidatus Woesebacteria bacterium GW2011_GWD1_41_12]OGM83469.1 MAG: preprotein translocase subunit SecA [Candidatus Woesebacteria bacterium RIFOXYC1_FULL_41_14]OGM88011.1 MAG: preprotein translocase subunit SecA [Candidatus Woesebacteria bacterium RI